MADRIVQETTQHRMLLDFTGGWTSFTLICDAPLESMCHAEYLCGHDVWVKSGIQDGKPWHEAADFFVQGELELWSESNEPRPSSCWGWFDRSRCGYKEFLDDLASESGEGTLEFPVDLKWDPDIEGVRWSVAEIGRAHV